MNPPSSSWPTGNPLPQNFGTKELTPIAMSAWRAGLWSSRSSFANPPMNVSPTLIVSLDSEMEQDKWVEIYLAGGTDAGDNQASDASQSFCCI